MKDLTQGEVMVAVLKGALMGLAIGGLTSMVVDTNKRVLQTLWQFNCLAAKTAWGMTKATIEWSAQTEDDDES